MANVGSILSGGFRLFKEQPISVIIWAVVFALYSFATTALAMGGMAYNFEAMRVGAVSPAAAFGAIFLFGAIALVFWSVMLCAVYRVMLRPDERSFAGLRLGMDELRMIGLFLILVVAGIFLAIVFSLFFALVLGGTLAATGGGGGSVLLIILIYLAFLVGMIYFAVRFSLVFAMTFVRRRIAIDAGWALTRGNFWTLFLVYLVLFVIMLVLYSVLILPFSGPFMGEMMQAMRNPEAMQSAQAQAQLDLAARPIMVTIVLTLLSAIVQAVLHALNGGAAATAVRELLRDQGEVLDDDIEATAQIFE